MSHIELKVRGVELKISAADEAVTTILSQLPYLLEQIEHIADSKPRPEMPHAETQTN